MLEIRDYHGLGFRPLVHYGSWRVAALRYLDELHPEKIRSMEKHTATDEVFILIRGKAMLLLRSNDDEFSRIKVYEMQIGEVCNIKQNTWHTILLSRDAHIIIVENDDTGIQNSEFRALSDDDREMIRLLALGFFGEDR